ncbi:TPA: IMP dehydrogenase [Candidatus Geothermarchaeota archaeon]|nr:IMP dehydrogenase [Candidatus Geothermarchaeota archaeon]
MGRFLNKLLKIDTIYTFNDLIILPGKTYVEPKEVNLRSKASKRYTINLPFISSPMDTVTGSELAIALAREGGLGILHRNCSVDEQVSMAKKVKRAESTIIRDVIVIKPEATVSEAVEIMETYDIHGLPVVEDGDRLVGIVTWRDVRYSDRNVTVSDVMTPKNRLVVANTEVSIDEAKRLMQRHRVEKLPIVDDKWVLKGLITIKDLELRGKYPMASRDEEGRLLVGAAISPYDIERAKKLDRYVDILVIDVAHFHNENVIKATKKIVNNVSADVIAGNLGTKEGVLETLTRIEDIAGLRVGIGSGSICTTGVVTKVASPTLYATIQASEALEELGLHGTIPVIADGGIKNTGDIALALASGASSVMIGNLFAGTKESPGRLIAIHGKYYKEYYGMGSARAKSKRADLDRYSKPSKDVDEGVEGWVPYRGAVKDLIRELIGGLQASMGYVGARDIYELWDKARFGYILPNGYNEIHPHDIIIPKGSNY